jgi:hypothetical protein
MAASKAYTVSSSWVLVAFNTTEVFLFANKQFDLELFIGPDTPADNTLDFVQIDADDNFSASSLTANTDKIFIRCPAQEVIVKVLTV